MKPFIYRNFNKLQKLNKQDLEKLILQMRLDNELFYDIFNSIQKVIIVLDLNNTLLYYNKYAQILFPKIQSFNTLIDFVDDKKFYSYIDKSLENQHNLDDNIFYIHNKVYFISLIPLVENKSITGNILIISDKTEISQKEKEVNRDNNMQSFAKLSTSLAHEIKNPLTALSLHIQILEMQLEENKTPLVEKCLDILNKEIERLNHTVTEFLYSSNPLNTHFSYFFISEILEDIIDLVSPELKTLNIDFKVDIIESKDKQVLGDSNLIKQAILNLIQNAKNILEEKEDDKKIEIFCYVDNSSLYINIKDNGKGIKESDKKYLLNPYFTTRAEGTGLGLTIVYKIIKEHKGFLHIQSKEGKGALFSLQLPFISSKTIQLIYNE